MLQSSAAHVTSAASNAFKMWQARVRPYFSRVSLDNARDDGRLLPPQYDVLMKQLYTTRPYEQELRNCAHLFCGAGKTCARDSESIVAEHPLCSHLIRLRPRRLRRLLIILMVMISVEDLRAAFLPELAHRGVALVHKALIICSGGSTASIDEFAKHLKRPYGGALPPEFDLIQRALRIPLDLLEELVDHTVWYMKGDADASKLERYAVPLRCKLYHDAWIVIATPNTITADLKEGFVEHGDFARLIVCRAAHASVPMHS